MEIIEKEFNGMKVRVAEVNGEPRFVACDVCAILGLRNGRDAVSSLDADERDDVAVADAIGRVQRMTAVSEPGLYKLIFKSRKREAKEFTRWVAHEVLPAVREGRMKVTREEAFRMIKSDPLYPAWERQIVMTAMMRNNAAVIGNGFASFAEAVLPGGEFGEKSPVNGLPKDKIVKMHYRSDPRKHKPSAKQYEALLRPVAEAKRAMDEIALADSALVNVKNV